MPAQGTAQGSLMVYQTFLRQWGHIHQLNPSGKPNDDQAVYSIASTGRKMEVIHDELYNASGTHRVKDVVVVTRTPSESSLP